MPTPGFNNNPSGINGYGMKNCLKSHLHKLNKQFNIPSSRKPPPEDIATQAILEKVAEDINQENSVNTITACLSMEGMPLPCDFVHSVLVCHAPNGLNAHFPGVKGVPCSALVAIGPNHQHHADGFEKLNVQALQMGGIKDQWSSFLLHLVVIPNNHLAATIGHVYLDYVEKYQVMPTTFVMDKGTETGLMYSNQEALCTVFAPDIDVHEYPPYLFLRSVHNMPIEGLWHWFTKTHGVNLKLLIQSGQKDGIYHVNKDLHK
ncbi:hypothetical protein SCLCIDRAFT_16346 [Scleroderma citrinum Foug A]|uniref:MULE transposase domain-containing protein n=1 Tax=Scleroderma citrinum Foug A TaxID=1036808 RepID=A0A0C2ZFD6_9AGAM|nr:hypothetical protein SCLCIDRAFT_16346 [Scleroderma citrinum Foug A]